MEQIKIGWIGLGRMGTPIVKNLLKAGYQVFIFNRTKEKEKELVETGAKSEANPSKILECADVIFTMVSDDKAVKEIFESEDGLLSEELPGKLIIDMSTVSPDTSRYLAERCKDKKIDFLDAPVSGSVKPAQEGTLIILVGGKEESFQKAKPLFDVIGKLALHLGEHGAGSYAKLAINYLLALHLQGLAETVMFAEQNGIRKEDMLTIINEGALGNGLTKIKTPSILEDSYPPAFALKLLLKDIRLAKESGLSAPLSDPLYDSFIKAEQNGLGEEDCMAIISYLRGRKGA